MLGVGVNETTFQVLIETFVSRVRDSDEIQPTGSVEKTEADLIAEAKEVMAACRGISPEDLDGVSVEVFTNKMKEAAKSQFENNSDVHARHLFSDPGMREFFDRALDWAAVTGILNQKPHTLH